MPFIKNASLVLNAIDLWTQLRAMILLMAKYFAGKNYDFQVHILCKYFNGIELNKIIVTWIICHIRLCYGKNFGPKGYGFGGTGAVPALMSDGIGQYAEERVQ